MSEKTKELLVLSLKDKTIDADTDYLIKRGVKKVRNLTELSVTESGNEIRICTVSRTIHISDEGEQEIPSIPVCCHLPGEYLSDIVDVLIEELRSRAKKEA